MVYWEHEENIQNDGRRPGARSDGASGRLSAPRPPVLPIWPVRLQMVTYATGSPGPRDEMDRTIGGQRERGTNALSQGTALLLNSGQAFLVRQGSLVFTEYLTIARESEL